MTPPEPDFVWGVTSSSTGSEGAAPAADWMRWEREGRAPRSGDGCGWTTNFVEDVASLRALGLNGLRITVEWARIEPRAGAIERDVVDRYRRMLEAARAAGLAPWVTLHHGSLPGWFADDERGFRDERARRYYWPRHVDRCAEWFDGLVTGWVPIDDPTGWALRGYLLGTRPPGERDDANARDALLGVLEANQAAAELLRGGGQHTMAVVGVRSPHTSATDDLTLDGIAWAYIDALSTNLFEHPALGSRQMPGLLDCFDVVGLAHPAADGTDARLLSEVVYRAAETVGRKPLLIAANGVATDNEETRESYVGDAIAQVRDLVDDGVALRGYFHHTGVDGYEWQDGFARPRGLLARDRSMKPAADFIRHALG